MSHPQNVTPMDANDQGHRFGNFPNYYTFHPPQNRLEVLETSSIMSYIRNGLFMIRSNSTSCEKQKLSNDDDAPSDDRPTGESAKKKPRIENELSINYQPQQEHIIYYCDLGCNEGDLTLAMANSLTKEHKEGESIDDNVKSPMVSDITPDKKVYCKCLGLDLDPILIERAKNKSKEVDLQLSVSRTPSKGDIDALFQVCNLCLETEHNNACTSFINHFKILHNNNNDTLTRNINQPVTTAQQRPIFHLTTIFSTTMWIHIHAGDDGLRDFLVRACSWTKHFLLIEPQPSVWYVSCCVCTNCKTHKLLC